MRDDRWKHLLACADAIEEAPSPEKAAELMRRLDSILIVFPRALDPVQDFEGYTVRRLALALRNALEDQMSARRR